MPTLASRSRSLVFALAFGLPTVAIIGCKAPPSDGPSEQPSDPPAPDTSAVARSLPAMAAGDESDTAVGTQGAVASAQSDATMAGLQVLEDGGNAVDAAVATGLALSVTHPSAGNLGGGGFMVIRFPDGKATAIDYREKAPLRATRDMYIGKDGKVTNESRLGAKAAGIPGNVAGFYMAHQKYGSLPWARVVQPAIDLAANGHVLDSFHADDIKYGVERMEKAKLEDSVAYFKKADGTLLAEGDVWVQPDMAKMLEGVRDGGRDGFYKGAFAEDLVGKVQKLGGIWTIEDLEQYEAVEREPLRFDYHGYEIIAMPPPSAGGVVLRQVLAGADKLGLGEMDYDDPERIHQYVEILRRTYADRNLLLGDPDFVKVPVEQLLDVTYMDKRLADIDPAKATPSSEVGAGVEIKESEQTTHFSVVDNSAMAVSNTFTLNGGFGSKVVVPGTGIILNNEMDDFTAKVGAPNMFGLVQGPQNSIEPGKRMLSSMTPTIVSKDGELRAVVGSPGGPTITTTVAQIIMQLVDHDRSITEAVRAPRVHHQWLPDGILTEEEAGQELMDALKAKGHEIRTGWRIGHANCIEVDPETGGFRAVADVDRDGGKAAAY